MTALRQKLLILFGKVVSTLWHARKCTERGGVAKWPQGACHPHLLRSVATTWAKMIIEVIRSERFLLVIHLNFQTLKCLSIHCAESASSEIPPPPEFFTIRVIKVSGKLKLLNEVNTNSN